MVRLSLMNNDLAMSRPADRSLMQLCAVAGDLDYFDILKGFIVR